MTRISGGGASAAKRAKLAASSKKKKATGNAPQTAEEKKAAKEYRERLQKYTEVQGALHGKSEINKVTNSTLKKEMKLSDKAKRSEKHMADSKQAVPP